MTQEQFNLPVFGVKKSQDFKGWLIVTCPYEDCGDTFLVRASRWQRPLKIQSKVGNKPVITIVGRPCPYCFRTARKAR